MCLHGRRDGFVCVCLCKTCVGVEGEMEGVRRYVLEEKIRCGSVRLYVCWRHGGVGVHTWRDGGVCRETGV